MVGLAELYPGTEVQISYKGKRGLATLVQSILN